MNGISLPPPYEPPPRESKPPPREPKPTSWGPGTYEVWIGGHHHVLDKIDAPYLDRLFIVATETFSRQDIIDHYVPDAADIYNINVTVEATNDTVVFWPPNQ